MRALKLSCIVCISILISESIFGQSVRFINNVYEEALATAQREDKLVFIDTWAEWCGPCKKMEPVFRDPEVASYMNQNFVNVRIDMGREGDVKQKVRLKYDVFFLPTLLIVDKFGEVMFRADNKILSAVELVNIARAVNTPQDYIMSQAAPQSAADPRLIDESKSVEKIVITDNMMLAKSSESGATVLVPRPNISDPNYSDDPTEKVLYTLGQDAELPPEILYEEAYFRYSQLSDGTHRETVNKYLNSQSDLSTEKNVKFIFDFLMNTETEQFDYLINNRILFENIIGVNKVKKSIGILVFQKMYQAIDRPNLEEATQLLSLVNSNTSEIIANQYILNRLFDEGNQEKFVMDAIQYLKKINPRDIQMAKKLGIVIDSNTAIHKNELSEATKCISRITDQLADYELQHLHAALLHKKGKASQAKDMAHKAIQSAKDQGLDFSKTTALMSAIQ